MADGAVTPGQNDLRRRVMTEAVEATKVDSPERGTVLQHGPSFFSQDEWTLSEGLADQQAATGDQESGIVLSEPPLKYPARDERNDCNDSEELSDETGTTQIAFVQLETRGATSHGLQPSFWESARIHTESIAAKLRKVGDYATANILSGCHTERTASICNDCGRRVLFFNRCDRVGCPLCARRLSAMRKHRVSWWVKQIDQPKHIVLTVRNSAELTKNSVAGLKGALQRLRRQRVFRGVKGGFWSMEVTNEGKGWHVHFHLLVDARWVDAKELSIAWGKQVGQDFAIVKVKDCRQEDYLGEVSKYTVEGSEIARWSGEDISTFLSVFRKCRTFGVFGSVFARRLDWNAELERLNLQFSSCECGGHSFRFRTESELLWEETVAGSIPPPVDCERPKPPAEHPEFPLSDRRDFGKH